MTDSDNLVRMEGEMAYSEHCELNQLHMDSYQEAFSLIIYDSVKLFSRILWWENLICLALVDCKTLIETPDFSELPNVKELKLEGCEGLVDLHASVGQHKKLQVLILKGCKSLEACGPGILEMSALEELVIHGCSNMYFLPEFGESMKNMEMLDVRKTNLVKLPESLGLFTGLKALNLEGCKNLVSLPQSISNSKSLEYVNIVGCHRLGRVPEERKEMESFEKFDKSGTTSDFTRTEHFYNVLTKKEYRGFRNDNDNEPKRSTWKYDVFLSFRGEDTRRGFTSHLYHALVRSGFKVFMDDEELRRGERISMALLEAIKESRFAIVILSENYASSSWCLDELKHILVSRDERGQIVIPIFYNVDPSDVRKQQNIFGQAFAQTEHRFQLDKQKVQEWRISLTRVANLSGFHSRQYRSEAELVDIVVQHLSELRSPVNESEALIGIEGRVEEMVSVLGIGMDDVRFIGIWGMGGVGKTTLARAIYERSHHLFDFHFFLSNVRELSERHGLLHLQYKLLSCLNIKNLQVEDTYHGKNMLGYIFQNRKVLLILDDVNDISQLENLAGSHEWFGDGSRIIITTRDFGLLASHEVDETYEVKPMNHNESLQLFHKKALRGVPLTKSLLELTELVLSYANGLPLALLVLGSYLSGRRETEWEGALNMLEKDSNNAIFKILRLSYDALNHMEKTIFLDIACFFNMWGKDEVTQILESCDLVATIGMKNLMDKSLLNEIEIGNVKYIEMHQLVQEMGRLIVFDDSRGDLGRRSRLWSSHDIDQVLNRNMGNKATEGLVLPFTFAANVANWNRSSFLRMHLLRLLIISCDFDLPNGLMGFPWALKVLHWYGYPCKALPCSEQLDQLVYLKMQNSKITQLTTYTQSMNKLEILDLSHSRKLLKTPDFVGFQNLKRLVFKGCTSLVTIHSSFGHLQCLVEVNLKGCWNLEVLPRKLEIESLEQFVLSGCIRLRNLPEFGEEMKKLKTLDVRETSIVTLPKSLGSLTSLETLDTRGCKKLVGLPHTFHKLKCLKVLDISDCLTFSELPKVIDENEALEKLDASETAIVEVPSSICCLQKLKTLSFHKCQKPTPNSIGWSLPWNQKSQYHSFSKKGLKLPVSMFNIESLTELDLSFCNIVDGIIPNDLSGLSSLQKLDLSGNEFVNLSDGFISNLLKLEFLYLNSCPKLQFLPLPSPGLKIMDAGECGSLRTLSDQKMLRLFASNPIQQDGQHAEGLKGITTFSVAIPGSEIPSWFENQNNLPLNEKQVASVTIDIPEEEWLGIGLCTVIDDTICLPRWSIDFKTSDGKYVSLPGRSREQEKEIKSCHLWILFWKIGEENRDELLQNYSQIRLKFTVWKHHRSRLVDVESINCGWRFICKKDLELLKDGENTFSSEEEHMQCNLFQSETSALCSEDEVKSDDSWMQFLADDPRFWF